jgi:hypothetical protein
MFVSDEPLRLQLMLRDDHGKRTGIRGGMVTILCVLFLLSAEFGGVVRKCTNIFAKALVAAAREKVRPICRIHSLHFLTFKLTLWKHAVMGTQKKEKNRKERQGKTGDGMGNVKVKGENFYR